MNSTYTIKDWMTALEISRQSSTIAQLQLETTKLREDVAEYLALPRLYCNIHFKS